MGDVKTIDACGLSCPMPVLETRKALSRITDGTVEVLVDLSVARDNVARFATKKGWSVNIEEEPKGIFKLTLKK